MATQNLFEKYGIKEVADVTFYRIERKNETYESQREITVASILNGHVDGDVPVTVKLLGGDLSIYWNREENLVYMTGPASVVFDGEIDLTFLGEE